SRRSPCRPTRSCPSSPTTGSSTPTCSRSPRCRRGTRPSGAPLRRGPFTDLLTVCSMPLLKSISGIPDPLFPVPPGVVLADEARTARRRFYPVTVLFTTYSVTVLSLSFALHPVYALAYLAMGVMTWTVLAYVVHRYLVHGRFADGPGFLGHRVHPFFRFKSQYLQYIPLHHWYHHSPRGSALGFGLTSGLWDRITGTRIPARRRVAGRQQETDLQDELWRQPRTEPHLYGSIPAVTSRRHAARPADAPPRAARRRGGGAGRPR